MFCETCRIAPPLPTASCPAGLGRTAWVDHATAVKTGKLLGVQQIVMGNGAEFNGAVALDVRRVDVRTGKVLAAAHAHSPLDLDDLRRATQQLAKELLSRPKP